MKTKNILLFLGIVLGILFLGVSQDRAQAEPERKGPIITHGFAVGSGQSGERNDCTGQDCHPITSSRETGGGNKTSHQFMYGNEVGGFEDP